MFNTYFKTICDSESLLLHIYINQPVTVFE